MLHLDDQPETIHLYVVREDVPQPQLFPIVLSVLALLILVSFCSLTPYRQPIIRTSLRVSAVPLYLKDFQASVQIVPTGIKTYPATFAHGILTITNGSIIGQSIPAGFTIQGVQTDSAVYVPGGNANGYGWAKVQAHALIAGKSGDFATFKINAVTGSSVYIRNLTAFTGGRDTYSVKVITKQDELTASILARNQLAVEASGFHYPCQETKYTSIYTKMYISWRCQFITYSAPSYLHITSVKLSGKEVLISGWFIEPMKRFGVK